MLRSNSSAPQSFRSCSNLNDTLFIINPASARGATLLSWIDASRKIVAAGVVFDQHVTSRAGDATEVTRKALAAGVTRVIAVGGDGTLGEVVNGYLNESGEPVNGNAAIGLLPSGTGSDFRRTLGITNRFELLQSLTRSETRLIDAARAEFLNLSGARASRFFINVASFGLGGDVSAMVNRWRDKLPRWIGGRARFAAASVAALGRYKNIAVSLRVDDRELTVDSNLIVVANGRFAGGGMMLAPHASVDDGLLDVIVTDGVSRFDVVKELPRIQRGSHLKNPKVTEWRARRITIDTSEEMAIDLDGEMVGFTPACLRVVPSAVRILA